MYTLDLAESELQLVKVIIELYKGDADFSELTIVYDKLLAAEQLPPEHSGEESAKGLRDMLEANRKEVSRLSQILSEQGDALRKATTTRDRLLRVIENLAEGFANR